MIDIVYILLGILTLVVGAIFVPKGEIEELVEEEPLLAGFLGLLAIILAALWPLVWGLTITAGACYFLMKGLVVLRSKTDDIPRFWEKK